MCGRSLTFRGVTLKSNRGYALSGAQHPNIDLSLSVGRSHHRTSSGIAVSLISLPAFRPIVRIPVRFHLELVIEVDVLGFAKLFQAFGAEFAPAA